MTYVYPVVSRRARGVSIGVNLNPNDACNWRCIYCQVPGLSYGKGPPIDLRRLETELRTMLDDVVHGDFMQRAVPEGARTLHDVAFSGNGEPTTSPDFGAAVGVVRRVLEQYELLGRIQVVVITNGSMAHRPAVQDAFRELSMMNGVIWFKLDSATAEGSRRTNQNAVPPEEHLAKLRSAAELCPTWIQTCLFAFDGAPPSETERSAYLDAVRSLVDAGTPLCGVQLYTVARESHQPEAPRLSPLSSEWLEGFAAPLRELGLTVQVSG